jgi:hypothetical protein
MKKTLQKKKLQLDKQTVRQLSPSELNGANGAIAVPTYTCNCPTRQHSFCDSCYDSDCCLMVP